MPPIPPSATSFRARAVAGVRRRSTDLTRRTRSAWCARRSGAGSVGPGFVAQGDVRLGLTPESSIGSHVHLDGEFGPVVLRARAGGRLVVGDHVYVNHNCDVGAVRDVRIGSRVLFAPYVSVVDDDFHPVERADYPGNDVGVGRDRGPTVVGDHVWLGRHVVVLGGVTIGEGTVVGANSVVTRDLPPRVFAAGSPARPLREIDVPEGWWRVGPWEGGAEAPAHLR